MTYWKVDFDDKIGLGDLLCAAAIIGLLLFGMAW
jgi:hypothetical protein